MGLLGYLISELPNDKIIRRISEELISNADLIIELLIKTIKCLN